MAYLASAVTALQADRGQVIPHHKHGGQGLLFHRDELDQWIEVAYESMDVWRSVWSTVTSEKPRRRRNVPARQRKSDASEG